MTATKWTNFRVAEGARKIADDLLLRVARYGWKSIGVDRNDPPTLGAILEEALRYLARRKS